MVFSRNLFDSCRWQAQKKPMIMIKDSLICFGFGSEDKMEIKLLNAKCSRFRIIGQKGDNEIHLFIGFAILIYTNFFFRSFVCRWLLNIMNIKQLRISCVLTIDHVIDGPKQVYQYLIGINDAERWQINTKHLQRKPNINWKLNEIQVNVVFGTRRKSCADRNFIKRDYKNATDSCHTTKNLKRCTLIDTIYSMLKPITLTEEEKKIMSETMNIEMVKSSLRYSTNSNIPNDKYKQIDVVNKRLRLCHLWSQISFVQLLSCLKEKKCLSSSPSTSSALDLLFNKIILSGERVFLIIVHCRWYLFRQSASNTTYSIYVYE